MTVSELIAELSKLPGDSLVVMSKDAEGNNYSPFDEVNECHYEAESTWSGECWREDDDEGPFGAVCLWPVN